MPRMISSVAPSDSCARSFSSEAARVGKDAQLAEACLVVHALGDEARCVDRCSRYPAAPS